MNMGCGRRWRFFELFAARHRPTPPPTRASARLSARRRGSATTAGNHGPRLRPDADPQARGPGRHDQPLDGHHRAFRRHAAGRLARARPHPDAGDAGTSGGGGREIHRRLGLRRRADVHPHRQRSARHPALYDRAQRYSDDDRAAPRERLSRAPRHRPVRPPLRGREGPRQDRDAGIHPTSAASRTGSSTWNRSTTT